MKSKLIFGFHAVTARLRHEAESIEEIYVDATRHDPRMRELLKAVQAAGVRVIQADESRLSSMVGSRRHQGVVAKAGAVSLARNLDELLDMVVGPPLILILDGITDPHNLGACLRVANAAGAHAVIAPKDRAAGITPAVSKVASGAAEATPYLMVTNLARTLAAIKERNIWVVGADERAEKTLHETDLPDSIAWVLGAEGEGMRRLTRESCDLLVRIPMRGEVESLNVSVSAGVCLFESVRRR